MTTKQTQQIKNKEWYSLNKDQFLRNKKQDYETFYKYYYKIRVLLKKFPEIIIPDNILNMQINNKQTDYKTKYLQIKTIIDNHIIATIENNIIETPTNGKRRTYKKQILLID